MILRRSQLLHAVLHSLHVRRNAFAVALRRVGSLIDEGRIRRGEKVLSNCLYSCQWGLLLFPFSEQHCCFCWATIGVFLLIHGNVSVVVYLD